MTGPNTNEARAMREGMTMQKVRYSPASMAEVSMGAPGIGSEKQ